MLPLLLLNILLRMLLKLFQFLEDNSLKLKLPLEALNSITTKPWTTFMLPKLLRKLLIRLLLLPMPKVHHQWISSRENQPMSSMDASIKFSPQLQELFPLLSSSPTVLNFPLAMSWLGENAQLKKISISEMSFTIQETLLATALAPLQSRRRTDSSYLFLNSYLYSIFMLMKKIWSLCYLLVEIMT